MGFLDILFHGDHHVHVLNDSHAVDSDGDGFSDALEIEAGTDPFNAASHPILSGLHDLDGDGFSDVIERLLGTSPSDVYDRPDAVLAHHFPAGTDVNCNRLGLA